MITKQMMRIMLISLCLCTGSSFADTLKVPPAPSAVPVRGLSMDAVENKLGKPVRVISGVGQPPITRWVYPEYTIYFEYQHVVHAVPRTRHTGLPR